jgi:hypothetical protein
MKKQLLIIFIVLFSVFVYFSCTNKKTAESETNLNQEIVQQEAFVSKTVYVIPQNGLNLRSEPGIGGTRVKLLSYNTELTILERSEAPEAIDNLLDYWYKVDTGDETGWVFGGYLSDKKVLDENYLVDNDFYKYIKLTNCEITTGYSVPNIRNVTMGFGDDYDLVPLNPIDSNQLFYFWEGFRIILVDDVSLDEEVILTIRNSKHEFNRILDLKPLESFYNVPVHYDRVLFEYKFWLSDGNNWRLTVESNDRIFLDEELRNGPIFSILFNELDETPLVVNDLRNLELNTEYTYRCIKYGTDIIIIYHSHDQQVFRPVLYLLPDKTNDYME